MVSYVLFHDLFQFVVSMSDGKVALQADDVRHFCNPNIKEGSEVEDQRLRHTSVARYSSTNQLLMQHLVNDNGGLIYDQQLVELAM